MHEPPSEDGQTFCEEINKCRYSNYVSLGILSENHLEFSFVGTLFFRPRCYSVPPLPRRAPPHSVAVGAPAVRVAAYPPSKTMSSKAKKTAGQPKIPLGVKINKLYKNLI